MRTLKTFPTYLLALLFIGFAACEDYNDHSVDVETGSVSFDGYYAVGNSLTAGYQSNALYSEAQLYAFPNLIANQAGLKGEFDTPLVTPGLGNRIEVASFTNNPISPITTTTTSLVPSGAPQQPADGFNNIGIPGAVLADYLNADGNLAARASANPAYSFAIGQQATNNGSIHGYIAGKNPTLVSFWLGNNDILGYATSGGLRPFTLPQGHPQGVDFQTMYSNAIGSILGINDEVKVIAANIPDVTSIAFTTTVGPGFVAGVQASGQDANISNVYVQTNFYSANPAIGASENKVPFAAYDLTSLTDPGTVSILLTAQSYMSYVGVSANQQAPTYNAQAVGAIVGYWKNFLVTAGVITQAQADAMNADQVEGTIEQATYGQYAQEFGVTPQQAAQELTAAGFDIEFDQPFALHPHNPLPSQFVLDSNELSIASSIVGIYNQIINGVLASSDRAVLVDVNSIFGDITANGGITVDGELLTPTILSLFSLDGVHPTNKGHGLVANEFIKVLNAEFNAELREINLESLPNGIPLGSAQ